MRRATCTTRALPRHHQYKRRSGLNTTQASHKTCDMNLGVCYLLLTALVRHVGSLLNASLSCYDCQGLVGYPSDTCSAPAVATTQKKHCTSCFSTLLNDGPYNMYIQRGCLNGSNAPPSGCSDISSNQKTCYCSTSDLCNNGSLSNIKDTQLVPN